MRWDENGSQTPRVKLARPARPSTWSASSLLMAKASWSWSSSSPLLCGHACSASGGGPEPTAAEDAAVGRGSETRLDKEKGPHSPGGGEGKASFPGGRADCEPGLSSPPSPHRGEQGIRSGGGGGGVKEGQPRGPKNKSQQQREDVREPQSPRPWFPSCVPGVCSEPQGTPVSRPTCSHGSRAAWLGPAGCRGKKRTCTLGPHPHRGCG